MSNILKVLLKVAVGIFAIMLWVVPVVTMAAPISPNFGRSTELNWLQFEGYVQIQPSYRESRGAIYHAARGHFWYTNTQDTSKYSTEWGNDKYDTRILSQQKIVSDSLNPIAPKATFYHNFHWVADGAGSAWPVSIPIVTEYSSLPSHPSRIDVGVS